MQSCYISYQCTQWKSRTCSLTLRPPRSMFTMWKHGRVDGTVAQLRRVGEKMSGPRPQAPTPPSLEKIQNTTYALCVSRRYIFHFFLRVFSLCASNWVCRHTPLSAPTFLRKFYHLTCVEPWGLSHVDQRMHRKIYIYRKKRKKNCLLVSFQPQWNVTDKYFFSHHYT